MIRFRPLFGVAAALCFIPSSAAAQTVVLRVTDADAARPIFGALSYLVGEDGRTVKNALTDERGRALILGIPAGTYRVRVEMIGMATAETELFVIASGTTVSKDIRLASSVIQLEGIEVELEGGRCEVRPRDEGLLVARVWDEARKALSAAAFTDQLGTYRYETMTYTRTLDGDTRVILKEEQSRRGGYMRTPFESLPAEDLVENGFVQPDGAELVYYAPDANVLLSDPFLDTHCFKMVNVGTEPEGLLGLGFEPTGEDKRVVDISGVMWLDPETIELQSLEFRYEYLQLELTAPDVGGRVVFRRMPDGTWIVPEWWIRMAVVGSQTDYEGRRRPYIAQYRQTGGQVLEVREAGGRSLGRRVQTGGVEGVVTDSIGVPLAGVRVGVVGSNQEVFSNVEGHYSITGLTEGRYRVRFVDPKLEAVGFIPEPVARDVIRGEISSFDYHMPSVGDVLFESCRDESVREGSIILGGLVRDARGRVVPGAAVSVEWSDFSTNTVRIYEKLEGFDTTAGTTGFFRFCGVPDDQRLTLVAEFGGLQSEPTEVFLTFDDGAMLTVLHLPAGVPGSTAPGAMAQPIGRTVLVEIDTSMGGVTAEIYVERAPVTAENFLTYVDGVVFDGGSFFRSVRMDNQPNDSVRIEVIQGGPDRLLVRDRLRPSIPLERTRETGLRHMDGSLSMARSRPDTGQSQFFVSIGDQPSLDFGGNRNLDGQGFAVFGRVIEGMDVVRRIHQGAVDAQRLVEPVQIHSIRRVVSEVDRARLPAAMR